MLEQSVEDYLTERVVYNGGMCEKLVTPGKVGTPDRLITWPGVIHFVETKAPNGVLESWQERDHARRRRLGHLVKVLWNNDMVDDYIACCKNRGLCQSSY